MNTFRNDRGRPVSRPQDASPAAKQAKADLRVTHRPDDALEPAPLKPCTACGHDPAADLLALSDERGLWLRRLLAAERRGFARGVASMAGKYERGFADGVIAFKHGQHALHEALQLALARWNGWREDFGRPREDDYVGGPVGWDGGEPDPAAERLVQFGGPVVHWHRRCNRACYAIEPGRPYGLLDAARILAKLPGDYADQIEALRARAAHLGLAEREAS